MVGKGGDLIDLTGDVASLVVPPPAVTLSKRVARLLLQRWRDLGGTEQEQALAEALTAALSVGVATAARVDGADAAWLDGVACTVFDEIVTSPADLRAFVDAAANRREVDRAWREVLRGRLDRLDRTSLDATVDLDALVSGFPRWFRSALWRATMLGGRPLSQLWDQLGREPRWAHPSGPARHDMAALVEYYRVGFAGRLADLDALDGWLRDGVEPFAFLHEPTGSGKTALLVNWLDRVRLNPEFDGWSVVFVPISRRYHTDDAVTIWQTLAGQLAMCHSTALARSDTAPELLRGLVGDYLTRELPDGRRLLVVIDALDEAVGWQPTPGLLRGGSESDVRILCSARRLADRSQASWLHELGWDPARTFTPAPLSPLHRDAIAELLANFAPEVARSSYVADIVGEIARISHGDPLTVRLVIEDIAAGRVPAQELPDHPTGLGDYFARSLREISATSLDSDATYQLLGCCAMAMGPLTHADLAALSPEHLGRQSSRRQAAREVARYIMGDGSDAAGYVFSHPKLRELYAGGELDEAEWSRLADRFLDYGAKAWSDAPRTSMPDYVRRFWLTHLAACGQWSVIHDVVFGGDGRAVGSTLLWAGDRFRAEGSYAGYLADVDLVWQHAEARDDVATAYRCALISARIRSTSGGLPPELLTHLVTTGTPEGRWSPRAAIEHIRQMPPSSEHDAAAALLGLIEAAAAAEGALSGWPWDATFSAVREFTLDWSRARAVSGLAAYLPEPQLHAAWSVAHDIASAEPRAWALSSLATHLPEPERPVIVAEALTAVRELADEWTAARTLGRLASFLPEPLPAEVVVTALELEDDLARADALSRLGPSLPLDALEDAVAAARDLAFGWARAKMLSSLAPCLPASSCGAVAREALLDARELTYPGPRSLLLFAIASSLPEPDQTSVGREALTALDELGSDAERARALTKVASRLTGSLLSEAASAARGLVDAEARAGALLALAPRLPEPDQSEAMDDALAAVRRVVGSQSRVLLLASAASHLSEPQLAEALSITQQLVGGDAQAEALARLAPHLPEQLLDDAMAIASSLIDDHRARALAAFVTQVPAQEGAAVVGEALSAARQLTDDAARAEALSGVAPYLPSSFLTEATSAARELVDSEARARVLSALVAHLSESDGAAVAQEAVSSIRQVTDDWARARLLPQLASVVSETSSPEVLAATIELRLEGARAEALSELAIHLPERLLPEAVLAARKLAGVWPRARALSALASSMPQPDRATIAREALPAARALTNGGPRSRVLIALASHLPGPEGTSVAHEALDAVRDLTDDGARCKALSSMAPHLPASLSAEAMSLSRGIASDAGRARALSALASHLPERERTDCCREALLATERLTGELRLQALSTLVPDLPEPERSDVATELVSASQALGNEWTRSRLLAVAAPLLPERSLDEALDFARDLTQAYARATALAALAARLPPTDRDHVVAEALSVVTRVADIEARADVLSRLCALMEEAAERSRTWPREQWLRLLRGASTHGAPAVLGETGRLAGWLRAVCDDVEIAAVLRSIVEVPRCRW
jgi:hypothetical protein